MAVRNWSSRSIGSTLQHNIFYALIRVGGYRLAYALLFFVVLWYTLLPTVRKRSLAYRLRRFPDDTGPAQWLHAARLHVTLGKVLVDRAVAGITGNFQVRTEAPEAAQIAALHAEGKGVILVTAHVGFWQMAARSLRDFVDAPVSILLHREAGDNDKHFFEHGKEKYRITTLDPEDGRASAVAMLQALRRGELVALMGDRAYGNDAHTVRVSFLGGEIPLPYNAYRLASASGAPVVVFFAYREGPCRARHEIAAVLRVPENAGRNGSAYLPYLERFAVALHDAVRKEPYQFFNFYDMWE
ncbi:MAG: Lipid A biosynthesis lauroyltransferase [Desulfovibrio sp.]